MPSVKKQLKDWLGNRSPVTHKRVTRVVNGARQAPVVRHYRRWRIANSYLRPRRSNAQRWIFQRTEESNFLYDISPRGRMDLAAMLASFMDADAAHVQSLFDEIARAQPLATFCSEHGGAELFPGRREAWYVITRLCAPTTVVETGVADGLGSLILLSALAQNERDGHSGRYIGIDIVDGAGSWARKWLRPLDEFIVGESTSGIDSSRSPIDLLILDSDHDPKYEAKELEVLGPLLSPNGIVISDNCHVSSALRDYSQVHSRPFMIWREEPINHWYPGASLGLSLPPKHKAIRGPVDS